MAIDNDDWIVPPPTPGTVVLGVRAADDVELSPAALAALERLAAELGLDVQVGDDTSGFCAPSKFCSQNCVSNSASDCYIYVTCKMEQRTCPKKA